VILARDIYTSSRSECLSLYFDQDHITRSLCRRAEDFDITLHAGIPSAIEPRIGIEARRTHFCRLSLDIRQLAFVERLKSVEVPIVSESHERAVEPNTQ